MLLSKNFGRRWLSSLWRRTNKSKPDSTTSEPVAPPGPQSSEMPHRPSSSPAYDGATVQTLLQTLKSSAKLTNSKVYDPPSNVEDVVEKVVRQNLTGNGLANEWRSFSFSDTRLKYKILSELIAQFDCDVPNFLLSDIKNVEDVIAHFKSPSLSATTASARANPLEQLGAMQIRGELPPNIHVQVEYPNRVVRGSSGDALAGEEDDYRPKVYTGVDNVVTSIKYRRKYQGYTAKIKEPIV